MIGSQQLVELRSAVGDAALLEHEARDVEGAKVSLTLRPSDPDGVAAAVQAANDLGSAC